MLSRKVGVRCLPPFDGTPESGAESAMSELITLEVLDFLDQRQFSRKRDVADPKGN